MREILFRGKSIKTGEWISGYPIISPDGNQAVICSDAFYVDGICQWKTHEVIPETIGQFTGEIDKNGNKIFEDDIVNLDGDSWEVHRGVWLTLCKRSNDKISVNLLGIPDEKNINIIVSGNIHENKKGVEMNYFGIHGV